VIANEGGIDDEYIGPIKIHDSYATVDLPEGMPLELYNTLQRTRVAVKPMKFTLANDEMGVAIDSAPPGTSAIDEQLSWQSDETSQRTR
jgi:hypothetical protein